MMGFDPQILLTSDLRRARETAAALGRRFTLKPRLRKDLRERHFGSWEGRTLEQVLAEAGISGRARKDPFLAFEPEGGESMADFAARMRGFLEAVLKEYPGGRIAAVTHGGPVRIAACLAAGIPVRRYYSLGRPGNVGLTLLGHQGGIWWVETYNDMAHLESSGAEVRERQKERL
jgi:alpha-ribazole phosphatase